MLPRERIPLKSAALAFLATCLAWGGAALASDEPATPEPESEPDKILYAVGLALSRSLTNYGLTEEDVAKVQRGLADGVLRREPAVDLEAYGPRIEDYLAGRRSTVTEKEKTAGVAFCDKMATEEGATRLDSGLVYFEELAGSGPQATTTDTVKVHYHGTLRDGEVFDTSMVEGGEPATFSLASVVPCFSEGIARMRVGGRSKLVCPAELAYGDRGYPPMIPPGATLVFEVELLEIVGGGETPAPTP